MDGPQRPRRLAGTPTGAYSRYVEDEVVPHIRRTCGDGNARIITAGASFGGFHAANQFFRRPDLFGGMIGMSAFYDLAPSYFKGYSDDNCYFNNPAWFVPNMSGSLLDLARDSRIILASGRGAYEAPECSERFAETLSSKGIPHWLDMWGADVNHDWPWWRRMLPYHLESMGL